MNRFRPFLVLPPSNPGPWGGEGMEELKRQFSVTSYRSALAALILCGLLVSDCSFARGTDLSLRRVELREKFDSSLSKIRENFGKDRRELGEKYTGALQKLEVELQGKGKLEELLGVRTEREMFVKSETVGSDGAPELIRMRTLYIESRAPIDKSEKEEIAHLTEAYLRQLETLQADLTREGDIETALAVKKEADLARSSLTAGVDAAAGLEPVAAASTAPEEFEPMPAMQHAPVGVDIFKHGEWPLKIALPQANYRIEGTRNVEGEKGREMLLLPGSVFRGADEKARWLVGNSTLVAREVEFDGFTLHGDLGSRLYFEKCHFKDMNLGKGGAWFGGRFMSRWQFRECRIEGSFTERWQSRLFGLQMVNCHVERVEFPPIEYDKDDKPSDLAVQNWALVKNTHFRKCVIPLSVLSLLEDCTFEGCRFVDDPKPLVFDSTITRTIYLDDCQWNVKQQPAGFIVEQKKLSEKP